jgi:large subunit ribosomal protein L17
MAGGHLKYRHLGRKSSHRQALLRNLVTSLFTHESITTTWPKAKEAQRLAEKLITLGKKNTENTKRKALSVFYVRWLEAPYMHGRANMELQTPHDLLPKLFGPLRERYANRPGGYTRVLRVEPTKPDQAPSAILELVDGPKDIRFAMTARTLAKIEKEGKEVNELTQKNIVKVTRFRENGDAALREAVEEMAKLEVRDRNGAEKRWGGKI